MPTFINYNHKFENTNSSFENQKIIDYINLNNNEDYSNVLERENDWNLFHEFAKTRESLLNWYPFKENSEILEIGSGFGPLTGLLCDRVKTVTCTEEDYSIAKALEQRYKSRDNLTIYVGNVLELNLTEKFDYIIMCGILEYAGNGSKGEKEYTEYLQKIKLLLKSDGKLLIATENRYGIRYFCGEADPFTKIPFYGINRYPNGCNAYAFDKRELTEIIKESGLCFKMYYPMPDYKHPQLIFTDDYLPRSSLRERVVPYYWNQNSLVATEKDLYDDIVSNVVFPFFSNSFFVECGFDREFCDIIYIALSTDRGKKHGFATMIKKKNEVWKQALDIEGEDSLIQIYDNMMNLKKNGIETVPHYLMPMKLVMPYIELPTLSDVLKKALQTNKEEFMKLLDLLLNQILASSEHVEDEFNQLRKSDGDNKKYGIILKKSYIDMIPINCFYDSGKLIFFDQEFVFDNYPASYTMFRALKYTYSFITFANGIVPLEQMKLKYGLTELWEYYNSIEYEFVSQNRNFDTYGYIWRKSKVNKKDISKKFHPIGSKR